MNRIDRTFARLRRSKRKALIGYVTAGFPTKSAFFKLVPLLERSGLDLLELGVPFSDPIADGPTIQRASERALRQGVTLSWILQAVSSLRRKGIRLPIILMSYANPLLTHGLDRFFERAAAAGVDGLIVPDLILEEAAAFQRPARKCRIAMIYLAAPTTPDDRLRRIAHATRGFLYAVSLTGVTGARRSLPPGVMEFLGRLRRLTSKPVAVGFGLSTPDHVRAIRPSADGVIVGSALIREIETSRSNSFVNVARYVGSLQQALNPRGRKENHYAD